ncbi:MAG: 30S ribosomal protein S3 [Candidatus Buchananbacteria bacterium]|nr:30S ribosomal protein S3 [Candidatus Buchananbacteria bacterium]
MGQKVHPKAFRLNINKTWDSKWYANPKDFALYLRQDILVRKYITKKLATAGVSHVDIERSANALTVTIHAAKPGMIIGRGGQGADDLRRDVQSRFMKDGFSRRKGIKTLALNIVEVSKPGVDAMLVAQSIAIDIEKRVRFRRVIKQALGRVERAGAQGVKITVAGRLDGAEIAREETVFFGSIPLHTLRADIDYARMAAKTIYGTIGIKVWIYKGEVFETAEVVTK